MLPKGLKFFFILICCCFFDQQLKSQISANPTQGCAPLVGVQFTGVTGASGIQWTFGDGSFANINNPVHTFSNAGNYNVVYTATVSGSPVSHTITVNVYGKPTPNFTSSAPTNGCVPLTVTFTDASTGGGGSAITGWQWSFGDGGVSSAQNPNYTYSIGGQFDVTLIVTDSHGCDSSITKPDVITVSPKPTVIISNNPASLAACVVPFTVTFNGSSSVSNSPLGGSLTYQWDFGNTTTSNSATPAATTYTATGTYTVTLTCTDNNNCSQVATKTVSIIQPQVDVVVPDTICLGTNITIVDTSTASFTTWDFGDATSPVTIPIPNPVSHNYAAAGTYTITATSTIGSCNDVKTFVIVVDEAVAEFSSPSPHFSCNPTFSVPYTNLSSGGVSYSWSFSNGDTSTLANPTTIFSQNSLNPYTIFEDLPLTATLTVTSAFGCTDVITHTLDTLHRLTAFFYTDGKQGCTPLTITFTDSSFSESAEVNYEWHFGDGSPVISGPADSIVTHTYNTPGYYDAYLVLTNADGCVDTSFFYDIVAATAPDPSFTFAPSVVCPQDTVFITNNTDPADSVQHWHVISDATYFSGCINDPNPGWNYTHTGLHDVTLVGYSYGCRNDTTVPMQVTVKGPIATGRFHTQCGDSAYKVMFEAFLQDGDSAVWNYGDGATQTVIGNGAHITYHTYNASGDYNAILTGYNGTSGCIPYKDSLTVTVRKINAAFTNAINACSGIGSAYSAISSVDVMASCGVGYTWLFTDTTGGVNTTYPPFVTEDSILNKPMPQGNYIIQLIVKDANECHDTATGSIRISGVTAAFAISDTVGCLPTFNINTIQNSVSDTTIVSYNWTFGDGSPASNNIAPSHSYTSAISPSQNYTITLTAVNELGCTNTSTLVVTVNAPIPTLNTTSLIYICSGSSVGFSGGGVTGANNYAWNFGDGSPVQNTATGTTTHTFTPGGTYNVNVSVSDPAGCQGLSNTVQVYVQDYPVAGFEYQNQCDSTSNAACAGCAIVFTDTSVNAFPGPRQWNLGTGGPIVGSTSVGTTYTTPGSYPIQLIVSSTYGCRDTLRDTLVVYGAEADFSMDKNAICKGDDINFTIFDTTNVYTWHWDFGDGTDTTMYSPIPHEFNYHPPGGVNNITLIYWTQDSACKYSLVKPITIHQVIAGFNRNNEMAVPDSIHCLGTIDVFTNTSQNANTYNWNFGDGNISSATSPSHQYAAAGIYYVDLFISDNLYNCKDTIRKRMEIIAAPTAVIDGNDTCQGKPALLSATGASNLSFSWSPGTLVNDSTITNPIANITQTTTFTVTITSPEGCVSTETTTVNIQQPPLSILWDTTVVIGQTAPIPGYAGSGMIYNWTPTDNLSCTTCSNPVSSSLVDIVYTSSVTDTMGCFNVTNSFTVKIIPESTVGVPTAFTPDGDGTNDIIYVDGWGIKKLLYFKIYNRWGQLLFESNDLEKGWDGYFNGVLQNMETYVYQASAETYTDAEPVVIKGSFKLIR